MRLSGLPFSSLSMPLKFTKVGTTAVAADGADSATANAYLRPRKVPRSISV
jgi:hypothetical protein